MANLGIALQFPTPPLDLTHREALPGNPYSAGIHLLDRVRGPINCDAFGIYWVNTLNPIGIGRTVGQNTIRFEEPIGQLLQVKEDILSVVQNGPVVPIIEDQGIMMFDEFPILRVSAWVQVGCQFNFFWVVVF
jgi:hypothetical protein